MKPHLTVVRLLLCLVAVFIALAPSAAESPSSRQLPTVRIADVINPVVAAFFSESLKEANEQDAPAFLLELDTPGGLDSAMRTMIQGILGSRIPVVVYVFPPGGRAASAGALVTLAADFAAMAPGTNIGAAHPVAIGFTGNGGDKDQTMIEKAVNDAVAYARSIAKERRRNVDWAERIVRESISTPAREALQLGVVDLIAASEEELLKELDGRSYFRDGRELTLRTEGMELAPLEMNWRQKLLSALSNPTVAYLLLMLGILGIFFEISQPGVILPGAVGAIALLLALFAFQSLPVNYAGVLLLLLAMVLFILEIKVQSYGMLTVGGIVSLALGSVMLIDTPVPYLQISRAVILATVAVVGGFTVLVLCFVVKAQRGRIVSGVEGMVGEEGKSVTVVHHEGRVFVHGEYWDAYSQEPVPADSRIEVVRVGSNLRLEVRQIENS